MTFWPQHIAATTYHGRFGAVKNAFRYKVNYVLIDPASKLGPALFSRNRANIVSVHETDHGGEPGKGRGHIWARQVLQGFGLPNVEDHQILLLTQPKVMGYVFNPVSFWLVLRDDHLIAVIAEVNNTFGDRHSYVCAHPDFVPITAEDQLSAKKVFHVSPFQDIIGDYQFNFDISPDRIEIRIAHKNGPDGLVATLAGPRAPLTNRNILISNLKRPFGSMRTTVLIHWQALRLKLKGAVYRPRPAPPESDIS